jgi:hypothetical protein
LGVRVERAQVLFGFDDVNRVNLILINGRWRALLAREAFSAGKHPRCQHRIAPKCDGCHILTAAYVK